MVTDNAETIAAIATPPGPGGIGVIRISGSLSSAILARLFVPRNSRDAYKSHRMYYGWIVEPETDSPIDEVLAVYMRSPLTYTTEDIVEIQCHGSYLVLQKILGLIFAAGARPAEPGEFTKRAFLNGRIDLTQAEAVLDLVRARTTEGLNLVTAQLQGRLFTEVNKVRETLTAARAVLEVAIDFPEDDADIMNPGEMREKIEQEAVAPLASLVAAADHGKIFREGISAVILGRPNVGKSSLLNTLLREERALVTAVPGTTRDTIEEYINIKGMPVRIVDTAGIRDTVETVEEMGIQRARAKMAEADLVLFMLDASEPLIHEDLLLFENVRQSNLKNRVLLVLNKIDLAPGADPGSIARKMGGAPIVPVSAKLNQGIRELEEAIFSMVTAGTGLGDTTVGVAPNLRHQAALAKGIEACRRILDGIDNLPPDLLAIELQSALDHLGDIVGETTTEDVLDMIFERFCIGK